MTHFCRSKWYALVFLNVKVIHTPKSTNKIYRSTASLKNDRFSAAQSIEMHGFSDIYNNGVLFLQSIGFKWKNIKFQTH